MQVSLQWLVHWLLFLPSSFKAFSTQISLLFLFLLHLLLHWCIRLRIPLSDATSFYIWENVLLVTIFKSLASSTWSRGYFCVFQKCLPAGLRGMVTEDIYQPLQASIEKVLYCQEVDVVNHVFSPIFVNMKLSVWLLTVATYVHKNLESLPIKKYAMAKAVLEPSPF